MVIVPCGTIWWSVFDFRHSAQCSYYMLNVSKVLIKHPRFNKRWVWCGMAVRQKKWLIMRSFWTSVEQQTYGEICNEGATLVVQDRTRPVTSIGHQVGRRVFWEGPKFYEQRPIVLNYFHHNFPGGAKKFAGGSLPTLVTGLDRTITQLHLHTFISIGAFNGDKTPKRRLRKGMGHT